MADEKTTDGAPLLEVSNLRVAFPTRTGMAEAVRDGVDGLHFRAGDAADLARVMTRAMTEPGLWERLVSNIPAVRTTDEAAAKHIILYDELSAGGAGAPRDEVSSGSMAR